MPEILPIRPEQVEEARRLIYTVAHGQFHPSEPLEEVIARWESERQLKDMDDVQKNYFENGGIFLVCMDGGKMVGTGGLRRLSEGTAEVKRLYFWPEYQGQGLGYRMMMALLAFARQKGYRKVRLGTDPDGQSHALSFYRRLGFYEIEYEAAEPDEQWLEIVLDEGPGEL